MYLAFCFYLALDMLLHMGVRWVRERVPYADRIFRVNFDHIQTDVEIWELARISVKSCE